MKGQVLGFSGDSGAISGEDGQRYAFVLAEWKGERPPQPRDAVDFVGHDGKASEIYPTGSAFGATLSDLGGALRKGAADAANSGSGSGATAFIAERPQVILLALVVIIMLLLPFATGGGQSSTALAFPGDMQKGTDVLTSTSQAMGGLIGPEAASGMPSTGALTIATYLTYLFYLIPLISVFAIFRDATGKRLRALELATGALCVLTLPIFWMAQSGLSQAMGPFGGAAASSFHFAFGGFALVLCGILLVLTGLGVVKRTPGL